MSFEVEIKFRNADHAALAARLQAYAADASMEVVQEDAYLGHPSRDFAQTNEALRIRRIGQENRVTYKGPRLSGPTKTREEIELPFADGEASFDRLVHLFNCLGFQPVATIRKRRTTYHLRWHDREVEVALDQAENLGAFAEVETIAANEADLPHAQAAVLNLATALGLADVEPRSYLRMALEERARTAGRNS